MKLIDRITGAPNGPRPSSTEVLHELCSQSPDVLGINATLLGRTVADVVRDGLTHDQLLYLRQTNMSQRNLLLMPRLQAVAAAVISSNLEHARSFNSGSVLADYLLQRSIQGGTPLTSALSWQIAIAAEAPSDSPTEGLYTAAIAALDSQPVLSTAFEIGQHGLPGGTDPRAARFGAGVVALYGLAAAYSVTHSQQP